MRKEAESLKTLPAPVLQVGRFSAVGLAGTGTYYLLLWSMVELLGARVLVATSLAFLVVVFQNYVLHYVWTFRATRPHSAALPRFVAMSLVGFWLNWGVMFAGVSRLGFNYLLVQAVAIATVIAWNFALSEAWIFPKESNFASHH